MVRQMQNLLLNSFKDRAMAYVFKNVISKSIKIFSRLDLCEGLYYNTYVISCACFKHQ
jgi:hypothetical protein